MYKDLYMDYLSISIAIYGYQYMYLCDYLILYFILHTSLTKYYLYRIQITLGAFLKKSFVDRNIQIEEIEITEHNII